MSSKLSGIFFLILSVVCFISAGSFLLDLLLVIAGLWFLNKALRLLQRPNLYQYSSRIFFDLKRNGF